MWYEILPYFGLMIGCAVAADFITGPFTKLRSGRYRDNQTGESNWQDYRAIVRDRYKTGQKYKRVGLEGIPDAE